MKTPKPKPLTPEDLKSLVQSLAVLVRESVRDEIAPLKREILQLRGYLDPPTLDSERGRELLALAAPKNGTS